MDAETITFITDQNRQLKNDLKDIVEVNGTVVRAKIESEVDRLDKRFIPVEKDVKILKKETSIFRWAHRNPKVAIITAVVFVACVAISLHTVGVKRIVERLIRIELNE